MKTVISFLFAGFLVANLPAFSQEDERQNRHQISTLFKNRGEHSSGGYFAATNKFTSIDGKYANLVEIYGGWYINHKWLIGVAAAASTNDIPVDYIHSTKPGYHMSYEYGQCGLMTEYVIGSNKAVHLAFQLFGGGGFTMQYHRPNQYSEQYWDDFEDDEHDVNWFAVVEPGIKVELNVLRWLRVAPGISYRLTDQASGRGLSDEKLSGTSVNVTLKLGRF